MSKLTVVAAERNNDMDYLEFWKRPHVNVQNPRFRNITEPHAKSFEWVWIEGSTGPGFVEWLRNGKGLFWISGKPGSGKSTLMKHVFEDPRTSSLLSNDPGNPVKMLRYFFHALGQTTEKQFRGFLSLVLFQLIDVFPEIAAEAIPVFKQECDSGKPAAGWICSETGLREIFRLITKNIHTRRTVCLFLDGLDECEGNQRDHIGFLISWLGTDGPLDLKICIASRPLAEIEIRLSHCSGFKIHEWTSEDIRIYASDRLIETAALLAAHINPTERHIPLSLIENIVKNASGVFLWVKLVVDELIIGMEEGDYPSELQRRLDNLPPELKELYKRIIDQVPIRNLHDTINYFWLLFALEELEEYRYPEQRLNSFLNFTVAASCNPQEALEIPVQETASNKRYVELCKQMIQRLQSRCRTLVQVAPPDDIEESDDDTEESDDDTEQSDTIAAFDSCQTPDEALFGYSVTLIHRTVEEYLCKPEIDRALRSKVRNELLQDPHVALMAASLHLLKATMPWPSWCLETIDSSNFEVERVFSRKSMEAVSALINKCIRGAQVAELSTGFAQTNYIDELDRVLSKVHPQWARFWYEYSELLKTKKDEIDMLSLAVRGGLDLYVKDKLATEDFTLRLGSARPLLQCAIDGDISGSMIQLLLENGADPNEVWNGTSIWENAMNRWPFDYYRETDSAFILILKHGADANQMVATKDGFSTVLNIAILELISAKWMTPETAETVETLIRTLLEYGANPDAKDSNGISARDLAKRGDCDPIGMKMILEADALAPQALLKRRRSQISSEGEGKDSSSTCAVVKRGRIQDDREDI